MTIRNLYPDIRPSLNLDFANSKRLDSRITFTRASTGTYTDESGIIRTAAANEARFDHDSDGNSLGLLIEESRTNRRKYSNDFSSNVYVATGVTVTPNHSLSPDGSITATLVSDTATTSAHLLEGFSKTNSRFTTVTGENITCSVFVKPVQGTQYIRLLNRQVPNAFARGYVAFDVVNKTVSSSESSYGVIPYGNGWYRIWFSFTAPGNETISQRISFAGGASYLGGNDSFLVFGVCVENGSFPTSYIPTTSSTVTRSADVASMTGTNFSSWYNQDQGTFTLKTSAIRSGAIGILLGGISNTVYGEVEIARVNNEVWFVDYLTSPFRKLIHDVSVGENRISGSYDNQTAQAIAVNGTVSTTSQNFNTSTNVITGISLMRRHTQSFESNGHIASLTYYPVRLPDATLQALTL